MRKSRSNEFKKRPPNVREVREAQALAKKISQKLLDLMEAKSE